MKTFSLAAAVLVLGLSMTVADAEAKRLGGGKSSGMQRQATTQQAPATTPGQTPASTQAASAAAPAAAAAGTAAAATSKRSWMGPLAGIAAGLGLAALASHFGFGEAMANMLMIGLLVMAVVMVIGFVMRKRAAAAMGGNAASGNGLAYAGAGAGAGAGADHSATPQAAADMNSPMARTANHGGSLIGAGIGAGVAGGAGAGAQTAPNAHWPADFDEAAFSRNAKVQFIRLQAANDAGNLEDLRSFTTPEMFAELKMDMADRGTATSQTDVVTIEAKVLNVVLEAYQHVVSVQFSGTIREDGQAQAEPFTEIWHLTKPISGSTGWLLSGIQQAQ
jgi:predicted lipid-binding transport protein (Tim44 family)